MTVMIQKTQIILLVQSRSIVIISVHPFFLDCELASVIWSNRSAAYAKLLKYDEACSDALMCIQVHPAWYKVN